MSIPSQNPKFEAQPRAQADVKLITWKWKDFSANAYQLPDGSIAMSYRQMAVKVCQNKNTAKEFVLKANLPQITVRFKNSLWGTLVPLASVAAYWKHIDAFDSKTIQAFLGWRAIEEYLAEVEQRPFCPWPSQPFLILQAVYNLNILINKPLLRVLALAQPDAQREYRIEIASALELIGVSPQWLNKCRPKTRTKLHHRGFTGVQLTQYLLEAKNPTLIAPMQSQQLVSSNTVTLRECLIIWEYFAERKYGSAIACLKALAAESFEHRIAKVASPREPKKVFQITSSLRLTPSIQSIYQSWQILQLVINHIPQNIFWKDRNSVYLGCNQNFARLAGIETPEQIVGKTDYDLPWRKEEADWFRQCDARIMNNNTPEYGIVETQLQADGQRPLVNTTKIPLLDVEGNVTGLVGIY